MKTIYHHHHHHHLQLFLFTGKLPTVTEYNKYAVEINKTAADTFRYLNFDKLPDFVATSKDVDFVPTNNLIMTIIPHNLIMTII
jgi:hypothetical protein